MSDTAPATRQQILRKRAIALAVKPRTEEDEGPRLDVVEITLAHEKYAVESTYVREVLLLREVTPLPCSPDYVLGLINVRGQILSVIDLRVFFGLPRESATRTTTVVILRSGDMEVGVVADGVAEARTIPLESLYPALPTLTGVREAWLRGIAEGEIVVLDAARLLEDKSIVVNEEVKGGER
ncbi:MAG: chemotaxis protein CheW [bacterium]